MNLRQLTQFVALAEAGNFHKAAERLHMAQPPLSVSIRKLEEELGAMLFLRTPNGVQLTAEGEAMLDDARLALFHAGQCQQSVAAAMHGEGGVLRIGIVGSSTYLLLPRLIPSFRLRYPKVDLELSEYTTSGILEGLVARRLDVGLVRYPVLAPNRCLLTTMEDDEFVVAVSASSPLAQHAHLALSQLADEPFIMYDQLKVPNLFAVAMMRCQQSGFTPRIAQNALQVQTILSLVESGLGIALVPGVARRYVTQGLKFLSLSDTPPNFRIGIALARLPENKSRLVEKFLHHAQAICQPKAHACSQNAPAPGFEAIEISPSLP